MLNQDNIRRHLADVYCELGKTEMVFEMLRPRLDELEGEQREHSRVYRRLALPYADACAREPFIPPPASNDIWAVSVPPLAAHDLAAHHHVHVLPTRPRERRSTQCTWGRETAKKARTQQHFESLVNHIKSLETRVRELENELLRTKRHSNGRSHSTHSGSQSHSHGSDATATPTTSIAGSASLSPRTSPIAKFEPDDDEKVPPQREDSDEELEPLDDLDELDEEKKGGARDGGGNASGEEDSEIEQLIAPTRHLVVRHFLSLRSLCLVPDSDVLIRSTCFFPCLVPHR